MEAFREPVPDPTRDLRQAWQQLRQAEPTLRIRNAARRLGVSELELLLTEPAENARRLLADFPLLYRKLGELGRVMTLARNDQVVHETTGQAGRFTVANHSNIGLCLGEIDLRVFFNHWAHGYAVVEETARGTRRSLQFFDASGTAVHKVYAVEGTRRAAWDGLCEWFAAEDQRPELDLARVESVERSAGSANREQLAQDWSAITDVHQFNAILRRHKIDRLTALELMEGQWAWPVAVESLERLLGDVAQAGTPIMVFVGNRGIVQIYTGAVSQLRRTGPWYNVLDPNFNLHVNTAEIASLWVVKRPSDDGAITSLESFNARGELILSLFGERKPGKPELAAWRQHVVVLEKLS